MFVGATSQYIDGDGKTRAITFRAPRGEVTIITPPIPPMNIPTDRKIVSVDVDTAREFARSLGLAITSQRIVDGETHGLFFSSNMEGLYFVYIPILPTAPLKGVEISTEPDPLATPLDVEVAPSMQRSTSKLERYRRARKLAEILKQYTLFTYARDPTKWSDNSIVVVDGYEYDLEGLNRKVYYDGNDIIYDSAGRIIVPSEETKSRLLNYLSISLYTGVEMRATPGPIESYYKSVSDFRPSPSQLIFIDLASVKRWMRSRAEIAAVEIVSPSLLPKNTTPYFYRSAKLGDGKLIIIQNVENGDMDLAIAVSYRWIRDRINDGFAPEISSSVVDISYNIQTIDGRRGTTMRRTDEIATLLDYGGGYYAAILFLN